MSKPSSAFPLFGALLLAVVALAVSSCTSGPEPAAELAADRARWNAMHEVAVAERARWQAVQELAADGKVDELAGELEQLRTTVAVAMVERERLDSLVATWHEALVEREEAAAAPLDGRQLVLDLLRLYATAALEVFSPELRAKWPDVFDAVDANRDGTLTAEELEAFVPRSPTDRERIYRVALFTLQQLLRHVHR